MVPPEEGWTFERVEEALVEAWGFLMRMPDVERDWLNSCAKSSMPKIVRSIGEGDYFEDAPGRRGLRTGEVDLVNRVFLGQGAWIEWVQLRDRKLVAAVMRCMGVRRVGGFAWSDVAQIMGWSAGPDALRKRYDRAVHRIAVHLSEAPKA